jgi:hypothetical protein
MQTKIYPLNLLVHWEAGEEEPWRLATILPNQQITLQDYCIVQAQ